jgi:CelD/BcsL family acetyltransferase involved in cellulose biosynthesis
VKVSTIPIDDSAWGEFVSAHTEATPFHLPAWASVIADCYRFQTFVLAAHDSDGEIAAGIPAAAVRSPFGRMRWVSLPYSDVCPPLIRPDIAPDEVTRLIGEYVLGGQTPRLEIRSDIAGAEGVHPVEVGYNHVLSLPSDPAELRPNKGHRYTRNRAVREGVTVTHGTAAEDIDTFYRLHTLTRRRHGVPVQPRRFFDLIWQRLIAEGHGFVATARSEGDVLAAGVYLGHNGTLVAKYHASDPAKPDKGAGYLIDWETMVFGCTEGYRCLDMGRSDLDASGLRLYKSSWGAEERPLIYTHISHVPPGEGHGPSVGELPKRIIRSSPPWVCQALGQALYRWTA